MACPVDGGCSNEAKWRFTQFTSNSTSAAFEIKEVPSEPYKVTDTVNVNGVTNAVRPITWNLRRV